MNPEPTVEEQFDPALLSYFDKLADSVLVVLSRVNFVARQQEDLGRVVARFDDRSVEHYFVPLHAHHVLDLVVAARQGLVRTLDLVASDGTMTPLIESGVYLFPQIVSEAVDV